MEVWKQLKKYFRKQVKLNSIKIYTYEQLRYFQDYKKYHLDLNNLPDTTDNKDIQNLDLENFDLEINIRKLWVPYDRETFYRYSIPTNKTRFLRLNRTNLKGNSVEGDLTYFHDERFGNVYIWYSENTFDEIYKEKYPRFFLPKNAPSELKEKYYNPKIKDFVIQKKSTGEIVKKGIAYTRQILTFEEYLKYYEFLKGKYLGNFKINEKDYIMISFIEHYGLEKTEKILQQIANLSLPLNLTLSIFKFTEVEDWETIFSNNVIPNNEALEPIIKKIHTKELQRVKKQ